MFKIMNYELMVVTRAGDAEAIIGRVEKSIKEASASNLAVNKLGKKTLAYPIAKQTDGEYFVFNFEAPGEAVATISQRLKLEQEAILRYLIIKTKVLVKAAGQSEKGVERDRPAAKAKVTVRTKPTEAAKKQKKVKKSKPQRAKAVKGKSKK